MAESKLPKHFVIRRAALVSKNMSEEFNNIKVYAISKNRLKAKLSGKFCTDMETEYISLLYYCAVLYLFRSKFIQRVFELKDEITIFIAKINKR